MESDTLATPRFDVAWHASLLEATFCFQFTLIKLMKASMSIDWVGSSKISTDWTSSGHYSQYSYAYFASRRRGLLALYPFFFKWTSRISMNPWWLICSKFAKKLGQPTSLIMENQSIYAKMTWKPIWTRRIWPIPTKITKNAIDHLNNDENRSDSSSFPCSIANDWHEITVFTTNFSGARKQLAQNLSRAFSITQKPPKKSLHRQSHQ